MIKIYFDDVLINENYYAGLTRDCSLFNESFRVGVTICDTYSLTLNKDYGNNIPDIVTIYEDDTLVKTLYVDSWKENDFTIEFSLMDRMVDFNFNYDASKIIEEAPEEKVKLIDILIDICSEIGMETDITEFNQSELEVSWYDNSITAREYIGYMAELDGAYAYITADDKLAFKPFKSINTTKLSFDDISKYKVGEKNQITRVLLDDGLQYYEATDGEEGMTYYVDINNVFCTNSEAVKNLYEKLKDQPFYNFSTNNIPIVADVGDIISIADGVTTYPVIFCLDGKINYSGSSWFGGLNCDIHNADQVETEYIDTESRVKAIKIRVDRDENEISQLITQTENIEDNLNNNYYTITKTNELIQNSSEGITNTFSEAGGNNVLRNTGLWFKESTKSTLNYIYPSETLYPSENTFAVEQANWEYWAGFALKVSNDQATLNTSIRLQRGNFIQEQDVPNGNYSISFMYKKLIKLADVRVTINDKEYILDSEDWTQFYTGKQDNEGNYITFPIEVTSRHITIKFSSDTDNSLELYDLMCNKGTVKLAYSQNENEITTDTVNISKGITITSSTTDTKFRANSDGIRVVNNNTDEEITKFTDKGMTTKEAIVENEATIVKLLIQDIDDQTWLTRM